MPPQSQAATAVAKAQLAPITSFVPYERAVEFGRDVCGDLRVAERREWLVSNGIGGFASGTVGGLASRRYHGLLIAALKPPLGRTLLVSKNCPTLPRNDNGRKS
jgi:hypothetical protein